MKLSATLFSALALMLFISILPAQAQQASVLFPPQTDAAFESQWRVIVTDVDDNVVADSLFTSQETVGFEGDLASEILFYSISPYPPLAQRVIRTEGSRAFAALSDLIDLSALDDFGLPVDFDADVDLINLDVAPGTSVELAAQNLRIELPEEILDLIDLPTGITLGDSVDIDISLNYERLQPRNFNNSLGVFTAEGGRLALNLDVTLTVVVPIFGPQPFTIPILESFGPEFYMAEGFGLVYEELPPTSIAIVLSIFDINQPIADINGSIYEKQSLTEVPGTSIPAPGNAEIAGLISLHPNYPNPFNPTTNLVFELSESAQVLIEVFDLQGRRVAVAASAGFSSGAHHLPFDASALASGMYSYRVTATGNQSGVQTTAFGRFTVLK
ncbi:MAG: T9SS type A sorting domain-containing protein [Candidatus Cyclonatronum sp.]|uniref:T9SS type A sorting domain-containing protein n=1 Tax=Cyclonatronum sp. TaxID=3024185 RepID=UPI0025C26DD6|nr:T9SS type A sorting domain-containing protein [Cyclonatronum sp.]MCH8486105.1 T9SS type A sorting domain-containing protein [Cyclonatronum sp.]